MRMNFWTYCSEVAQRVGIDLVLEHIKVVRQCWFEYQDVTECATVLQPTVTADDVSPLQFRQLIASLASSDGEGSRIRCPA